VDAHHGDGKRFVVHADDKLTGFRVLEAAIREAEHRQSGAKVQSTSEHPGDEPDRQALRVPPRADDGYLERRKMLIVICGGDSRAILQPSSTGHLCDSGAGATSCLGAAQIVVAFIGSGTMGF
jgi:hypothetical protein